MIQWSMVFANSMWILGLSVLLAAFSYRSYVKRALPESSNNEWNRRSYPFFSRVGFLLASMGLCLSSQSLVERAVWGMISLAILSEVLIKRMVILRRPGS